VRVPWNRAKTRGSGVAPELTLIRSMTTNGVTTNGVFPSGVVFLRRVGPFKRDFARRIDRVIDYFGAAPRRTAPRLRRRRGRFRAPGVEGR